MGWLHLVGLSYKQFTTHKRKRGEHEKGEGDRLLVRKMIVEREGKYMST